MKSLPLCIISAVLVIASPLSAASEFCGASYCVAGDVSEIMEKFDGVDFIVNYLKIDTYEASIYEGGNAVDSGEDAVRYVNGIRWHITRGARGTKIEAETGFQWPGYISIQVRGANRTLEEIERFLARFQLNPDLPEVEKFEKPKNG